MVRATKLLLRRQRDRARVVDLVTVTLPSLLIVALLSVAGCTGAGSGATESSETVQPRGANMAGPTQKVIIARSALENRPEPWVLSSPKSAVRSYLDWISYAYRIGESSVATPTMSAEQEVRVDSYNQMNLQNGKVIDQALDDITFGTPVTRGARTLVPVHEVWTYRYVSIADVGKTLAGPHTATYDTTYTVTKNSRGDWVVDSVAVKAIGEVK